jgi:putative hemolysin
MAPMRNTGPLALRVSSKRLPRPLLEAAGWCFDRLLGFHRFNALYSALPPHGTLEFAQTFLEAMKISVEMDGSPHDIPANGPLIVISNHPYGIIDGLALDALLLSVRKDATLMAVQPLKAISEFRDHFIFVGPRGRRRTREASVQGWRQTFQWIARGGALVVFPAGDAARFQWRRMAVTDRPWSPHIAALARRTRARVLPFYFHGHNSWGSQIAGLLCPPLHKLRLIAETNNKRGRTLRAKMGRVIEPSELSQFATDEEAIAFLRTETEKLARP